jgi:hypothetical protein
MTIQSDCGTLTYMTDNHHFTKSSAEAAADFFNAGGNTVCGGAGTSAALHSGLLAEAVLTERVTEALVPMFRLGAFDSPSDVEWKDRSKYNKSVVGRPEHAAIAREAAQKGTVLLENRNRTLPLKPSDYVGKTILVTGPYGGNESAYPGGFCFGDSTLKPNCAGSGMPGDILGTYYSGTPGHISTPIAAVRAAFLGATILHVSGCSHPWCGSSGLPDAPDLPAVAEAAARADLVLFFGGVSGHVGHGSSEGPPGQLDYYHTGHCHDLKNTSCHPFEFGAASEGLDRWNITLPSGQEALLKAASSNPRAPVVASIIGCFPVTSAGAASADAYVVAGCGGQEGGVGLVDVLTGAAAAGGRLPYTLHTQQSDLPDITVYGDLVNQTYRNRQFADTPPRYRFGDGRAFAEFGYSGLQVAPASPGVCDPITVSVDVANPEAFAADEVVQLYSRCPCGYTECQAGTCDNAALLTPPLTALIGFSRVTVSAKSTQTVRITILARQRARFRPAAGVDSGMLEEVRPGELWLTVGGGQLGSTTASAVLQTRVQVGGRPTPVARCLSQD